ncbi:unnamed protein product [Prunus armeniaca]
MNWLEATEFGEWSGEIWAAGFGIGSRGRGGRGQRDQRWRVGEMEEEGGEGEEERGDGRGRMGEGSRDGNGGLPPIPPRIPFFFFA